MTSAQICSSAAFFLVLQIALLPAGQVHLGVLRGGRALRAGLVLQLLIFLDDLDSEITDALIDLFIGLGAHCLVLEPMLPEDCLQFLN